MATLQKCSDMPGEISRLIQPCMAGSVQEAGARRSAMRNSRQARNGGVRQHHLAHADLLVHFGVEREDRLDLLQPGQ